MSRKQAKKSILFRNILLFVAIISIVAVTIFLVNQRSHTFPNPTLTNTPSLLPVTPTTQEVLMDTLQIAIDPTATSFPTPLDSNTPNFNENSKEDGVLILSKADGFLFPLVCI